MVMASRRTYADAVSWTRSARPRELSRSGFAVRAFGVFFVMGIAGFGVASIASPESFGQGGARVLSLGWPSIALVAMILIAAAVLIANRRRLARLASRNATNPYSLDPGQESAFEPAVNALSACARPLQIRFGIAWSWGPALVGVAGAVLAASAAYFAVYLVLAGFEVGLEIVAVAAGNLVVGFALFMVAAARLTTWRFATTVYRTVSPGSLS